MKLEIDDTAIVSVIRNAAAPLTFNEIGAKLELPQGDSRQLDRQLQRLRRAGIIAFRKTKGARAGWVSTHLASEEAKP